MSLDTSVVSGQIMRRTGRNRWLISGAMLVSAIGPAFFTNLQANTAVTTTWIWMVFTGLGAGSAQAVFAVIGQNAAPGDEAGVAMSDLTLFRQAGVSIGLSLIFTAFLDHLTWGLLRSQVIHSGAPGALVPSAPPVGFDPGQLTSVGNGPSAGIGQLAAHLPPGWQQTFVAGFHQAFSLALLANAVWIGVATALLTFTTPLLLRAVPLSSTEGAGQRQTLSSPYHAPSLPTRTSKATVHRRQSATIGCTVDPNEWQLKMRGKQREVGTRTKVTS